MCEEVCEKSKHKYASWITGLYNHAQSLEKKKEKKRLNGFFNWFQSVHCAGADNKGAMLPQGMKKAIKIWMEVRLNPTAMGSHLLALKGEVVSSKRWRGECLRENREGRKEWVSVMIESTQECQAGSPGLLWISEPAKMFLSFFFLLLLLLPDAFF